MDKRLLYIVFGLFVISYLVSRKTHPELLQEAKTKVMAMWNGKTATAETDSLASQWDKHRQEIFVQRVAESKRRAIAKYPTLAVADSEMNLRFVFRYQWMTKEANPRLQASNWPELLADDCAASMHTNVQPVASKPGMAAHPGGPPATSVATR